MLSFLSVTSIISLFLGIGLSRIILGRWINFTLFISLIFFLHNFSYTFTKLFNTEYASVIKFSDDALLVTLFHGFVGYWVMVFAYLFIASKSLFQKNIIFVDNVVPPHVWEFFYYLFALFAVIVSFALGGGSSGSYGEGQALTSAAAFNPLPLLFIIRGFMIGLSFATRFWLRMKVNYMFLCISFGFEFYQALFSGGRKLVFMSLLAPVVFYLMRNAVKLPKKTIFYCLCSFVVFPIISFVIMIGRGGIGNEGVLARVRSSFSQGGFIMDAMYEGINSTNSQGLQSWVYDVWNDGDLPCLWGKSYLQATINLIVPRPFQGPIVDWQANYVFKYHAYADVENMGYDFAFNAEAFINFGKYFFWIPYLVLGLILGWFYRRRGCGFIYFYVGCLIIVVGLVHFRTDSTAYMRMMFMGIVPFIVTRKFFGVKQIVDNSGV